MFRIFRNALSPWRRVLDWFQSVHHNIESLETCLGLVPECTGVLVYWFQSVLVYWFQSVHHNIELIIFTNYITMSCNE